MAFQVGRGLSDVTGEAADCGMLGYGKSDQRTKGIHTRLRARAFVFDDGANRVLLVVCDLPMITESITQEVLRRLAADYGGTYREENVLLTATHTHCGPGGYAHHLLYNLTTNGFHEKTFAAIVDGILEAVAQAHEDVAAAELTLASGELHGASSNRSASSFDRNPETDRIFFPAKVDPQTTLLTVSRDGTPVGAINFFATHGTSMTNRNCLISGDNKGYAGYHWERVVGGVDYRNRDRGAFVAAFAQTNAGDMSPNLNARPGMGASPACRGGPTADEFENTRIIGTLQYEAAANLLGTGTPIDAEAFSGVDARLTHVDLGDTLVRAEFTGDGREHRTSPALAAAAALAGTDEGKGFPGFRQGRNRIVDGISRLTAYRSARLRDAQAPKGIVLPASLVEHVYPMVQRIVPVQLIRIGRLHLIGIPGEVTIVAGLRLRRAVAAITGAALRDVLVVGYSNAYIHYVTTPEEYENQRYEGGSTLFGRWELPALVQTVSELAAAMRVGTPVPAGPTPPDLSRRRLSWLRPRPADVAVGGAFGEVVVQPPAHVMPGATVSATFVGAYPNNDLHRRGSYLEVQLRDGDRWRTVADDGDWATKFHWRRRGRAGSQVVITWDVPAGAEGTYRITYAGDARAADGTLTPIRGATREFTVAPARRP
jgi:neutral ceramidase